jgi:hypothetical protein
MRTLAQLARLVSGAVRRWRQRRAETSAARSELLSALHQLRCSSCGGDEVCGAQKWGDVWMVFCVTCGMYRLARS